MYLRIRIDWSLFVLLVIFLRSFFGVPGVEGVEIFLEDLHLTIVGFFIYATFFRVHLSPQLRNHWYDLLMLEMRILSLDFVHLLSVESEKCWEGPLGLVRMLLSLLLVLLLLFFADCRAFFRTFCWGALLFRIVLIVGGSIFVGFLPFLLILLLCFEFFGLFPLVFLLLFVGSDILVSDEFYLSEGFCENVGDSVELHEISGTVSIWWCPFIGSFGQCW